MNQKENKDVTLGHIDMGVNGKLFSTKKLLHDHISHVLGSKVKQIIEETQTNEFKEMIYDNIHKDCGFDIGETTLFKTVLEERLSPLVMLVTE